MIKRLWIKKMSREQRRKELKKQSGFKKKGLEKEIMSVNEYMEPEIRRRVHLEVEAFKDEMFIRYLLVTGKALSNEFGFGGKRIARMYQEIQKLLMDIRLGKESPSEMSKWLTERHKITVAVKDR